MCRNIRPLFNFEPPAGETDVRNASLQFIRKISGATGVERIFPLHAPVVDRIEVLRRGKVRRSKLFYLRGLRGKAARIEEKV